MQSTKGVEFALGDCGNYATQADWLLKTPAIQDGYVVQKVSSINNQWATPEDDGPLVYSENSLGKVLLFWEIWPIKQGERTYTERDAADDTFFQPFLTVDEGGTLSIIAEASFYTEQEMTDPVVNGPNGILGLDLFEGNHRVRQSGKAKSSDMEPQFWIATPKPRVVRKVQLAYECCPVEETQVICAFWKGAVNCP